MEAPTKKYNTKKVQLTVDEFGLTRGSNWPIYELQIQMNQTWWYKLK